MCNITTVISHNSSKKMFFVCFCNFFMEISYKKGSFGSCFFEVMRIKKATKLTLSLFSIYLKKYLFVIFNCNPFPN